jgi:hypothetical protein
MNCTARRKHCPKNELPETNFLMRGFLSTLPTFALVLVMVACSTSSSNEVTRVTSPDGRLDAILIELNGGATTSFGYEIKIAQHGGQPTQQLAYLYGAIRNEQAYGANLHWNGNDVLDISFLRTKAPPVLKSPIEVDGRAVRAVLQVGVPDPSAPPGGMSLNLKGH